MAPTSEIAVQLLPASIGTLALIYSNVQAFFSVGKIRYKEKDNDGKAVFKHPYRPWEDKSGSAAEHFRAAKAADNIREWTLYSMPLQWLIAIYGPEVPFVGAYLPWAGLVLTFVYARSNQAYLKAYTSSAEERIVPFRTRTNMWKLMALLSIVSIACTGARAVGVCCSACLPSCSQVAAISYE